MNRPIIITGFPYAFPYYWKVFEYLERKDEYIFILPKFWWAKKGKIQIKLTDKPGFIVYGLKTMSYGGKSLYGGLFKGWMPGIVIKLVHLRIKHKSRILYSCSEPNLLTTLYNSIMARCLGYRHVLFTWQNISPEKRMSGLKLKLSNTLVKLNLSLVDGIICGNKKAEDIIKSLNPRIKTTVCPISGVDIDKFHPNQQLTTNNQEQKTILFYGALDDRKGVDFLIGAFSKINNQNVRLLIIGTGPELDSLKSLAIEYNLQDKVIFKDWMKNEELPEILSNSSIFIYPSIPRGGWEEQFGYAMAEASASGVPVIATKTGSIDEVVRDGETGILVSPSNTDELADAMNLLLNNEPLRIKMGQAGVEYISRNYGHVVIAAKIANFLSSFNGSSR